MRTLLGLAFVAALVACGDAPAPRLDGSSDDAFKASVLALKEALPESDREAFDKALAFVVMSSVDLTEAMNGASPQSLAAEARVKMSGKTAAEVLAMADSLQQERAAAPN